MTSWAASYENQIKDEKSLLKETVDEDLTSKMDSLTTINFGE